MADISLSNWCLYSVLFGALQSSVRKIIGCFGFISFSFFLFSVPDLFRALVRFNVTTSPAFNLLATPFGQSNKAQEIKGRISGRWRNSTFGEKILWNTSTSTPFVHGKKMLSPGSAVTTEKTGHESTLLRSTKRFMVSVQRWISPWCYSYSHCAIIRELDRTEKCAS